MAKPRLLQGRLTQRRLWFAALALILVNLPALALAQPSLRNSFPGRRIGGGTRGECSARLLAHLVPANSVFAPGAAALIGLLEGPTAEPRPLELSFRPLTNAGTAVTAQARSSNRELAPAPAGVVLLKIAAVKTPTIWESGYRCTESAAPGSDPLDFVQSGSPPAASLLVADVQAADKPIEAGLKVLQAQCGKTVATAVVAKTFGLNDVVTLDWPQQLPVRCP